jgi:hypothetical protein
MERGLLCGETTARYGMKEEIDVLCDMWVFPHVYCYFVPLLYTNELWIERKIQCK